MDEAQERAIMEDSLESVMKATGQKLAGYLAPALTHTERTMDLLAEYGFLYTCDLFQDDQPQPLNVKTGRLISMPYSFGDQRHHRLQQLFGDAAAVRPDDQGSVRSTA